MKLKQLMEEFAGYSENGTKTFPIYKNPTKTDLANFFKEEVDLLDKFYDKFLTRKIEIRFVADIEKQDFYIYSSEYLHDSFMKQFFKIKKKSNDERFFYGIGILSKPDYKITFKGSFDFCGPREYIKSFKRKDLEFMSNYISNFEDIIEMYIRMFKSYLEVEKKSMSELTLVKKNLGK